jgi:hypothetical protein
MKNSFAWRRSRGVVTEGMPTIRVLRVWQQRRGHRGDDEAPGIDVHKVDD